MNNSNYSPSFNGGGNSFNLIHIHSKNVFDKIIKKNDLNGTIDIATSRLNVWNILIPYTPLQDNSYDKHYRYFYNSNYDMWYASYIDKSSIDYNINLGVRVLIKYRE